MKKELTSWAGLKKGTRFKIVKNTNSHNYPLNKVFTMKRDGHNINESDIAEEHYGGNNVYARDVELCFLTLKDLIKELKELKEEKEQIVSKINYCRASGSDYFDETAYKTFLILEELTTYDDNMIKAKKISEIINI